MKVIPWICKKYPKVYWIIGGDGRLKPLLKAMIKKCGLENRIELLGYVLHKNVPNVLNRGHIFLNTSITEAFCISALEAASVGLKVVTTNVGGTPEILPMDMLTLAEPNSESLFLNLSKVVTQFLNGEIVDPNEYHLRVKRYYSWEKVAKRTSKVYQYLYNKGPKKTGFGLITYSSSNLKLIFRS